ncbi:LOW QUALITY PROTEIN: hypothetical protein HID58_061559, partial [Brassica napus]
VFFFSFPSFSESMADGLLLLIFLLVSFSFVAGVTSRNITIENKCDYSVWPGTYSTNGPSLSTTGFLFRKGEARVINVPSSWRGRFWGRSLCSTNSTGGFSCVTGDCRSGNIECSGASSTPPTTLVELSLDTFNGQDFYDVSVVDGYNLPVIIVPQHPQRGQSCISVVPVRHSTRQFSVAPIQRRNVKRRLYSQNFKRECPLAYSYALDDQTMLFTCANSPNYVVTFCPSTIPNATKNNNSSSVAKSPFPAQTPSNGSSKSPFPAPTTLEPPSPSQPSKEATTRAKQKISWKLKLILGTLSLNPFDSTVMHITTPNIKGVDHKAKISKLMNVNCCKCKMRLFGEWSIMPTYHALSFLYLVSDCSPLAGLSAASVVVIIVIVAVIVRARNARKSEWSVENIDAVVMMKRYSYEKVKKMTNSFAHVLGKGGFGTVYKGKLPDGNHDVAVKILLESKGNGEEFINELASMSRTSHVNIVSLLGFCYEGNKRAIIYEFMPNGSLRQMSAKLEWEKLYDIALGVSRGLEYLHNRCISRIVHFDIKPQNILMDKDLCPKISDFGLAKLCKNKESIISMLDARGTAGYIAPEMIGATNIENVEHSGSNNSSMYFPDRIYKDLDRGEIMRIFGGQTTEDEEKIAKKMVLVGLWCIQTNPSHRPAMMKVIEMLEGSLEALEVPPKPLLCLPATVAETTEDSNETSSFANSSQFERGTLQATEDTLRFSNKEDSRYNKLCDKRFSVIVPASYVPEEEALNITHLESVLRKGFEAKLNMEEIPCQECLSTGEICGFSISGKGNYSMNLLILITIGTGSIVTAYLVMILVFLLCERRKKKALRKQNLEALVTSRLYSYRQIKKITKSFSEVVGRGGFGTVHKGKLLASISQTSHVNIVSLLGFCYEGSKRAIVYEFVENGSLDQSLNLDVSTLYGIALGVAKGIEYLHYEQGLCISTLNLRIVLLDDNLRPKVSDFGLAKLCQNQESILSSLDTRGTIGYIAPELFSRMYGSVSYKSDVYSYGMLVLEMIGARDKERVEKSDLNNSSAYFPDWIYKDLESGDSTKLLGGELNQEEEDIAKKMIIVGLWCIQLCPSDRPMMNEVIEMMEGSLDTLKAPPKPLLHMPMHNIPGSSQPSGESSIYSEV